MGNCWGKRVKASQSPSTTRTTTPGISNANSNEGQLSGSAGGASANNDGQILRGPNMRIFSYAELKSATSNFRPNSVLGEGGFGRVFKGWVDENTLTPTQIGSGLAIAVKKLNSESVQGWEEWQSEVNFLGTLSHPNIVKLLGYCWEEKELLLVYEFVAKGSLENHLFRRGPTHLLLSWNTRLKIAIGAARGLAFLHTSEKPVIYRDFKASNILLDMNYNAKVADFGLAKNGPVGGNSHVTTRIMGTYGYAAPEYVATGHLYVKSDVYGFGVVLLEMLTGLRALDTSRPSGKHNLVEWAKPQLSSRRKVQSLIDGRLEGKYPLKGAQQAAELTLKCLGGDPRIRPSMKEVLETLERIEAIKFKAKDPKGKEPKAGSAPTASPNRLSPRRHHPRNHHSPLHPHH